MKYLCCCRVDAEEMTLGQAREHFAQNLRPAFPPATRGYLVTDEDGEERWEWRGRFEKDNFPMLESDGETVTPAMITDFLGQIVERDVVGGKKKMRNRSRAGEVIERFFDPTNDGRIARESVRLEIRKRLNFVLQWALNGVAEPPVQDNKQ
jgi:hypothetical protein